MHPRARRATSIALSIALHALLLLWVATIAVTMPQPTQPGAMPVRIIEPRARPKAPAPKPPAPQQVAKAPPPEVPKPQVEPPPPPPPPEPEPKQKIPMPEQIVQQPDEGKNEVPPDTRFKSDRDTKVEKQQVKRGEPKPGESQPEQQAVAKPPPKPPKPAAPARPQPAREERPGRQQQVAKLPTLDRLLPNAMKLAQEGYGAPPEIVQDAPQEQPRRSFSGGNDGLFIPTGPVGTLDYLPDVREGDITLLNTKAEMFAPFVRRVAMRVFQNFWISLKKDLTAQITAQELVEAEAVMDPRGEMIGFTITNRSSRVTLGSDRRLQQACNVGFFDRNPPPGARWEDGNIHFILSTEIEMLGPQGGMVILAAGLK